MREKLNTEQVAEIRKRWAGGKVTQAQLARDYGVHQGHISRVVNYKNRSANRASAAEVFQRIHSAIR